MLNLSKDTYKLKCKSLFLQCWLKLNFRGVGLVCRWWVEVMSWWGWCWSWLAMTSIVAWHVGLLVCLFHWQLIPFFFWIAFCLRLPPWCSLVVDLGRLQCGSENYLTPMEKTQFFYSIILYLGSVITVYHKLLWSNRQYTIKYNIKYKISKTGYNIPPY